LCDVCPFEAEGATAIVWLATLIMAGGWIPKAALTVKNDDGGRYMPIANPHCKRI
jgi:hypothetical protein